MKAAVRPRLRFRRNLSGFFRDPPLPLVARALQLSSRTRVSFFVLPLCSVVVGCGGSGGAAARAALRLRSLVSSFFVGNRIVVLAPEATPNPCPF